jgi:hypothetical protein
VSRVFNRVRAASALIEAVFKPDKEVALAFGVSVRTIEYWRSRLKTDEDLQREYRKMAQEKLAPWLSEIPDVLDQAVSFLSVATKTADPTNPDAIKAITGAIATLSDLQIIHEALRERQSARAATD